jgi:hypothetical protein
MGQHVLVADPHAVNPRSRRSTCQRSLASQLVRP